MNQQTAVTCKVSVLIVATSLPMFLVGCVNDQSRLNTIEQKLTSINRKLDLIDEHVAMNNGSSSASQESVLARSLVEANADEKAAIIDKHLLQSSEFNAISIENVEQVLDCLESLTTILNHSDLNADQIKQVDQSQTRLIEFLKTGVTNSVRALHQSALTAKDFQAAQRFWSESDVMLEYFPSSNDPIAEQEFNILSSEHEEVASQVQNQFSQYYNRWACRQIKEASDIIADQSPESCVATCITYIGPIDPGQLEPLSLEIYSEFFESVKDQLPLAAYYQLAETLAVADRRSLSDIRIDP